ncbi:MAG: GNAT family N-acetyltransferase [Dehalococcoidia bacterium]
MPETRVRFATAADAGEIVRFVRGLAAFEREPLDRVRLTEEDVRRDGFGARPLFEVLIAEQATAAGTSAVGFALFFPHYSTWEGRAGLYVEDIFVVEEARGTGAGRALLTALARLAAERGAPRIDFAVLDWNPARGFYEALGATHEREWLPYRMDASAIARIAREAPPVEGAPSTDR